MARPVYILLGSQNAYGHAPLADLPPYLGGPQSQIYIWNMATATFQTLQAGVNNNDSGTTFGPEMTLGQELRQKHHGPVYLIKITTNDPELDAWAFNSLLYLNAIQIINDALWSIPDGEVQAIYWIPGEGATATSSVYESLLRLLVSYLREQLAEATLPFIVALPGLAAPAVRAAQQALSNHEENIGVYDGAALTYLTGTTLYDATSQLTLGYELANTSLNALIRPLFVPDLVNLKSRLRLSGVPTTVDAHQIIQDAVFSIRTQFFRRLQQTRINEILAYPRTNIPKTNEEYLRSLAETLEVKMVRLDLMRTLPMLFMDGSGQTLQVWNDEGAFRSLSKKDMEAEIARLMAEIEEGLQLLGGDTDIGDESGIHIFDGTADTLPIQMGSTLFPWLR